MKIYKPIGTSIRIGISTDEAWLASDTGLIACWERGRDLATEQPGIANLARAGALVPLPWKGGLERSIKAKRKYGTMRYLAMWQGLCGEELNIDTNIEREITCSRYGVTVTFTADVAKYEGA